MLALKAGFFVWDRSLFLGEIRRKPTKQGERGSIMRQQNGTVVLIHSSASSGRQWRSLSERLSDRYNVIAPDLSGYGPSDGDPGEYTFDDDCRLVRETIEAAQGPVHLIGHSCPVQIAMTHAASWACVWQHRGD